MKKGAASKDVESYLALVPEPGRSILKKMRAVIESVVPKEATEGISYGIPTFKYNGMLVSIAAFKKHCSFFPMSHAVIRKYRDALKSFVVSKGTIRFPLEKPLPASLLKKMVKDRIAEKDRK